LILALLYARFNAEAQGRKVAKKRKKAIAFHLKGHRYLIDSLRLCASASLR
jgi:hypothetical protein